MQLLSVRHSIKYLQNINIENYSFVSLYHNIVDKCLKYLNERTQQFVLFLSVLVRNWFSNEIVPVHGTYSIKQHQQGSNWMIFLSSVRCCKRWTCMLYLNKIEMWKKPHKFIMNTMSNEQMLRPYGKITTSIFGCQVQEVVFVLDYAGWIGTHQV